MENFERKTFEEIYDNLEQYVTNIRCDDCGSNYKCDNPFDGFSPTMDDIIKLNIVFENIDKFTVQQISDFFESNGK